MTINAKIIADSISNEGIRLTTFQLRYPKFIHGEFMTHRMFSRNASSSRAIPVERMIRDVLHDPAGPVFWGKNQKGMQAVEELDEFCKGQAVNGWLDAMKAAVHWAQTLHNLGAHKQIVNRIIEPWCHINVVATATNYANFYALRRHLAAQPEIKMLADAMWEAQSGSTPALLQPGEWHLPYVNDQEDLVELTENFDTFEERQLARRKISVARCARVSYLTQEGKRPSVAEDLALYERLVGSHPLHASPAEHQATPDTGHVVRHGPPECETVYGYRWLHPEQHGNFYGWIQLRKLLPGEYTAEPPYTPA